MAILRKTNPAYAAVAYRRTIVHSLITYLRRDYIGIDADPPQAMICEEVMASDAEVPLEEVTSYLEELEQEHHSLTLELNKFEFTRRNDDTKQQRQGKAKGRKGR